MPNKNNYFFGQITYAYHYESETLDIDSISNLKPRIGIFRYDLENYQSQFIGPDTTTYYYVGRVHKVAYMDKNGNYECEDYGFPTDSIITFKKYETDIKILGQPIKVLEFQSKLFWTRYYVSKDLKISPKTYKDHIAYNMSFYGHQTDGGLILRVVHKFKNYTMIGEVISLEPFEDEFSALQLANYPLCLKE